MALVKPNPYDIYTKATLKTANAIMEFSTVKVTLIPGSSERVQISASGIRINQATALFEPIAAQCVNAAGSSGKRSSLPVGSEVCKNWTPTVALTPKINPSTDGGPDTGIQTSSEEDSSWEC